MYADSSACRPQDSARALGLNTHRAGTPWLGWEAGDEQGRGQSLVWGLAKFDMLKGPSARRAGRQIHKSS